MTAIAIPRYSVSCWPPYPELLRTSEAAGAELAFTDPIKPFEFRSRALGEEHVGTWLALHATKKTAPEWRELLAWYGWQPQAIKRVTRGAICALIRFGEPVPFSAIGDLAVVTADGDHGALERSIQDTPGKPTYDPPGWPETSWYAWPVLEVIRLVAIPCKGKQSQPWKLPEAARDAIRQQFRANPHLPRLPGPPRVCRHTLPLPFAVPATMGISGRPNGAARNTHAIRGLGLAAPAGCGAEPHDVPAATVTGSR